VRVHRRLVGGELHRDDIGGGQRPGDQTPSRTSIPPRDTYTSIIGLAAVLVRAGPSR
jgi:hypothetical protein